MTLPPLNSVDDAFAARLAAALPPGTLSAAEPRFLEEPRGKHFGQKDALLARPRNVDEVATIVRHCAAARIGIVPFGGGTGLVGGQVLEVGPRPVILSLDRMNRVRAVHADENMIAVEAGVTLAAVQAAAEAAGRLFPLSLASEGTAQIGGNLSTNAGGVQVLRYGTARELCLGIEAVLPDGSVMNGMTRLRKDNTGYDLRDLLIGAEGTLGVITAAALRLFPRPATVLTAVLAVPDPDAALALLTRARERLDDRVTTFELIGRAGFDFMAEYFPETRRPLDPAPDWAVLIEAGGNDGEGLGAAFEAVIESAFADGLAVDGAIAASGAQAAEFWAFRETIPLANRRIGAVGSQDVSLPLSEIAGFIAEAPSRIAQIADVRINCFGHLGDGNLHYNLFPAAGRDRSDYATQSEALTQAVFDMVAERGGSFSAEHGVGRLRADELARRADPARYRAMRAIKAALDPAGVMNPGAVLP